MLDREKFFCSYFVGFKSRSFVKPHSDKDAYKAYTDQIPGMSHAPGFCFKIPEQVYRNQNGAISSDTG